MNDLLDLPSLAFSAFEFNDNASVAAYEEIIRLGNVYLTDKERQRCADGWQTRRQYAANIYVCLKPLRKPLNSRDL